MSDDKAAMREDADRTKKCRLLNLPREIRDRIYSCTLEEQPMIYESRRNVNLNHELVPTHCVERQSRGYQSLTQACRQLRAEYAPIYAAQSKIHVHHFDVPGYLLAGCPFLSFCNNGKLAGNIYLDCRPARSATHYYSDVEHIDIMPLIALCQDNPDVRVRCGEYGCVCGICEDCVSYEASWLAWDKDGLDHLFDVANTPRLWTWLNETIDNIILEYSVEGLRFVTKRGREEDWMVARPGMEEAWEEHCKRVHIPFAFGKVRFEKWEDFYKRMTGGAEVTLIETAHLLNG